MRKFRLFLPLFLSLFTAPLMAEISFVYSSANIDLDVQCGDSSGAIQYHHILRTCPMCALNPPPHFERESLLINSNPINLKAISIELKKITEFGNNIQAPRYFAAQLDLTIHDSNTSEVDSYVVICKSIRSHDIVIALLPDFN